MILIVAIAAAWSAACGNSTDANPTTPAATVTSVTVTSGSTSVGSFQLTATAKSTDGTSRDVTASAVWSSSDPSLATVSVTGLVTVVGTGAVDVRATYQGVSGSLHVLVARLPVVAVTVTGAPSAASSSFQLTAIARLSDGSTQDVTLSASWDSSNPQLATVSATGLVTATGAGELDLRATYQGVSGSVHVTVVGPQTFTITGVVTEAAPNAQPVVGARVQIVVGDHAFTDVTGAFVIPGVPGGRTIIEVSADGFQTWSNELLVDRDMQLNVTLVRATATP